MFERWHSTNHTTQPCFDEHGGRTELCFECTAHQLNVNLSNISHNARLKLIRQIFSISSEISFDQGTPPSLLIKPLMILIIACQQGREERNVAFSASNALCELTKNCLPTLVFQEYLEWIANIPSQQAYNIAPVWSSIDGMLFHNSSLAAVLLREQQTLLATVNIAPSSSPAPHDGDSDGRTDWRCHFFSILTIFRSLCLFGAILAQKLNSFICKKKNLIF